jgi:hypothetical protein
VSSPASSPTPLLPPRPARPPAQPRAHTLCFWTILILFVAALGYLGLLAFAGNTGALPSAAGLDGHRLAGFLLAVCTIVAVAAGIATRHQHR